MRFAGIVVALALLGSAGLAQASSREQCRNRSALDYDPPIVNLRFDNDLFGAEDQDQGYTNGVMVTLVSPNLLDYLDDPCLPTIARRLNQYLERLSTERYEQQNMVVGIGQVMFTPSDPDATTLIEDDRPYAAAFLVGLGYNARQGDRLRVSQLRVGMIGPSARGKEFQSEWHRIIGVDRFRGWQNQLRDEAVFQLVHEKMRRWPGERLSDGWDWDFISHWGGSLGNFATYANAGVEIRFGWRLPDDFGSTPLRPAGENTAPTRSANVERGWTAHGFLTTDARWVLRDISLDGNTFKDSHSVDKKPLVGDVGYGVAINKGNWKFAFARYHRSREFEGQRERPVFGSFTISRTLR